MFDYKSTLDNFIRIYQVVMFRIKHFFRQITIVKRVVKNDVVDNKRTKPVYFKNITGNFIFYVTGNGSIKKELNESFYIIFL